jgi:chlorophyll(ide) b reductase
METIKKFINKHSRIVTAAAVVGTFFVAKTIYKKFIKAAPINSLKGRKNLGFVVTGGSRGIGFCIAEQLLIAGHRVVICGREEKSLDAAKLALKNNSNLYTFVCDVSNASQVEAFATFAAESLGEIDCWINNAGVSAGLDAFENVDDKVFKNTVDVNLLGSMYCAKYAIKIMKNQKRGGHIINMEGFGSSGGVRPGISTYGTTKYAIVYLTKALQAECAQDHPNIGIHRTYPGLTITDFFGPNGKVKQTPEFAWVINAIGDTPENVGLGLTPRFLNLAGTGHHLEYVTQAYYGWRFATQWARTGQYFDKEGNWIGK